MAYLRLSNPTTNSCSYKVQLGNDFTLKYYDELRITGTDYGKSTNNVRGWVAQSWAAPTDIGASNVVTGRVTEGMSAGRTYTLYAYALAKNGTWYLAGTDTITMKGGGSTTVSPPTNVSVSVNGKKIRIRFTKGTNADVTLLGDSGKKVLGGVRSSSLELTASGYDSTFSFYLKSRASDGTESGWTQKYTTRTGPAPAKEIQNDVVYNETVAAGERGKWYKIKFAQSGKANFWINSAGLGSDLDLHVYNGHGADNTELGKSTYSPGNGAPDDAVKGLDVVAGVYYYVFVKDYGAGVCNFQIKAKNYPSKVGSIHPPTNIKTEVNGKKIKITFTKGANAYTTVLGGANKSVLGETSSNSFQLTASGYDGTFDIYLKSKSSGGQESAWSQKYAVRVGPAPATAIPEGRDYSDNMSASENGKWYKVKFAKNGKANFWINSAGLNKDIDLHVYDGHGRNNVVLGKSQNNPGPGQPDDIVRGIDVTAGKEYYIFVHNYKDYAGAFKVKAQNYPQGSVTVHPPTNIKIAVNGKKARITFTKGQNAYTTIMGDSRKTGGKSTTGNYFELDMPAYDTGYPVHFKSKSESGYESAWTKEYKISTGPSPAISLEEGKDLLNQVIAVGESGKWYKVVFAKNGKANFWINSSGLSNNIDLFVCETHGADAVSARMSSMNKPGEGDDIVRQVDVTAGVDYYAFVRNTGRGACTFNIKAQNYPQAPVVEVGVPIIIGKPEMISYEKKVIVNVKFKPGKNNTGIAVKNLNTNKFVAWPNPEAGKVELQVGSHNTKYRYGFYGKNGETLSKQGALVEFTTPVKPVVPKPGLTKGDEGPEVRGVQELLHTLGRLSKITGIFDSDTHRAVVEFQKDLGLHPDGIVDKDLEGKLAKSARQVKQAIPHLVVKEEPFKSFNVAAPMIMDKRQHLWTKVIANGSIIIHGQYSMFPVLEPSKYVSYDIKGSDNAAATLYAGAEKEFSADLNVNNITKLKLKKALDTIGYKVGSIGGGDVRVKLPIGRNISPYSFTFILEYCKTIAGHNVYLSLEVSLKRDPNRWKAGEAYAANVSAGLGWLNATTSTMLLCLAGVGIIAILGSAGAAAAPVGAKVIELVPEAKRYLDAADKAAA